MRNKTVCIGIPVYNEEQNILYLLKSILKQKMDGVVLKSIIIVSDGSTDHTIQEIKKCESKKIIMIQRKRRLGVCESLNEILNLCQSDMLVLLNGDVLLKDIRTIHNLLQPLLQEKHIGLVGGDIVPATQHTVTERILAQSHELKKEIWKRVNNGDNIYTCYGGIRALNKSLYSKLRFPDDLPEDAFSYLACKAFGLQYRYVEQAQVIFRVPSVLPDHIKQSIRFHAGKVQLEKIFGSTNVRQAYAIPVRVMIVALFFMFCRHPLKICSYIGISLLISLLQLRKTQFNARWDVAISSKRIIV